MLGPVLLSDQLAAVRDEALRVLVVGAGVAGVTLAQPVRRAGVAPVLLERRAADADLRVRARVDAAGRPGAAAPGGGRVHRERSVPVRRYALRDRAGRPLREHTLESLLAFGDHRGVERGELLAALTDDGGAVTDEPTVTALEQSADGVRAVLADGAGEQRAEFDVVIAAYGMHSATRSLVLPPEQVTGHDTGWGGRPLTDVRCSAGSSGRVGLVGDAAAGFLPTAGIGAGMAMGSAAVLGRLLAEATRDPVPETLRRFEARQRPRVESAQQNSRSLARLVFRTSRPVAVLRDTASRLVPLQTALAPIRRVLADRPGA